MPEKISIVDFIDPRSTTHMKEVLYMQTHGHWSGWMKKQFETHHVTFPPSWDTILESKLAAAWIQRHLFTSEYHDILKAPDDTYKA